MSMASERHRRTPRTRNELRAAIALREQLADARALVRQAQR